MKWFIVVYFLVDGSWIEADKIEKEGWSAVVQEDYLSCVEKINDSNERFKKIASYKEIELDIMFKCECRKNEENPKKINCKERNWYQKIYDKLFILK
tara:strand:+ start:374 stop:664 length:291 start_codon:yes stop_codon:yes gene_type:complete